MMHRLLRAAASGELPPWARMTAKRRRHVERVAQLMGEWAEVLAPRQVARWRAAGLLHDALKDATTNELRGMVPRRHREWPEPLLHAAAVAHVLKGQGVTDEGLLLALHYHPIGHPGFDAIGRALYMADFMEPGRTHDRKWLASLRERMPDDFQDVLFEVTGERMRNQLKGGKNLRLETVEFWNVQVEARES